MRKKRAHPNRIIVETGQNYQAHKEMAMEYILKNTVEGEEDDWLLCPGKHRRTSEEGE